MSVLAELSWPLIPAGNRIRYIWQEWLQDHLQDYHGGGILLTLDSLTQSLSMPDRGFELQLKVGPGLAHSVHAEPESLPVDADSIQAAVVSFGFDYTQTGSVLLGEIHRALEPQGLLYSLLLAPNNPWCLKSKVGLSDPRKLLPQQSIGLNRFNDWLGLLGFEIDEVETLACPWWRGFSHFQKTSEMNKAWLSAPIAYMIKAQKKVATMNPIKPLEKESTVAIGAMANLSTKQSC